MFVHIPKKMQLNKSIEKQEALLHTQEDPDDCMMQSVDKEPRKLGPKRRNINIWHLIQSL